MTSRTDIDRALDGYLADGPDRVGDQALLRALDAIDQTNQRRGLFAPWRFSLMITLPRLAAVALVAIIAIGGIAYLAGQRAGVGGTTPTPTTNPTPTLAAAAATPPDRGMSLDTATWRSFVTSRYGYTVAWPATGLWINAPATEDWAGQTGEEMWASPTDAPWVDKFYNQATQLTMTAVATTIPVGTSETAFIDAYEKAGPGTTNPCVELAKDMQQTSIDGHPALETTKCSQAGFVALGQRMYVFEISNPNEVPFLNAYLSTVKLPIDTTGWVPFVSKIYGFTVAHPAGWTAVAASAHWSLASPADAAEDTLTGPTDGSPHLMAFEVKLPAGTTADSFLQAYIQLAHGGDCYPTGPLPMITVDGHPGTLAYTGCNSSYYGAEATVVIGNRVWIFDLGGPDRSLILSFLSTVKIDASKVVD